MQQGAKVSHIAKRIGCSRGTVYKWWQRYQSTNAVMVRTRSGRKRVLTQSTEQRVVDLLTGSDSKTADEVAQLLLAEGVTPHKVHKTTVIRAARRASKRTGEKIWVQTGKPPKEMTAATKQKRLAFAAANKRRDWSNVMFTDRKKFHFCFPGSKVHPVRWVRGPAKGSSKAVNQPNHAQVLNVYAGITKYGPTAVHVVAGSSKHKSTFKNQQGKPAKNITTAEYKQVLQTLLKEGQKLFSVQGISTWVLQQDNDPTHKIAAAEVQQWNASKGSSVQLLSPWPPNSPDLSLIENFWGWVQQQVDKQGCKTFEEFKEAVIKQIAGVPKQHLTHMWDGMRARLNDVVVNGGGPTKH